MEADEIDSAPVAIVGVELGRVPVRQRPQLQEFGRAGAGAEGSERVARPSPAFALDRLLQRRVGIVEVEVGEFDRLVEDFVGDGAVGVEGAPEVVLSVGKGVHGAPPPSCASNATPSADEVGKGARGSPLLVGRELCPDEAC